MLNGRKKEKRSVLKANSRDSFVSRGHPLPQVPDAITRVLPCERDNPAPAFPSFPFALKCSKNIEMLIYNVVYF